MTKKRTDKERMDWLAEKPRCDWERIYFSSCEIQITAHLTWEKATRAAIDAAMDAEKRK